MGGGLFGGGGGGGGDPYAAERARQKKEEIKKKKEERFLALLQRGTGRVSGGPEMSGRRDVTPRGVGAGPQQDGPALNPLVQNLRSIMGG